MSAEDQIAALLESLGLDSNDDPELARTPERVATLLADLFAGLQEPRPSMSKFATTASDPVLLLDLPFRSMCVHHLLPFFGTIDIAYVPAGNAAGFGGFLRVIEHFATRPQVQERMVEEITHYLDDELSPEGVIVRCRARQMCVEMRRRSSPATFISLASRGCLTNGSLRTEILAQFQAHDGPL